MTTAETSLLDALPHAPVEAGAVARERLATTLADAGVLRAAWLLLVGRLSGGRARVRRMDGEGGWSLAVPRASTAADWLAQVAQAGQQTRPDGAEPAAEAGWCDRVPALQNPQAATAKAPTGLLVGSTQPLPDGQTELVLDHAVPTIAPDTAQLLLRLWRGLAEGLACGASLQDLGWLAPAERQRVLHDWNAQPREHAGAWDVVSGFSAAAAAGGEAQALRWRGGAMSYAELDTRSAQLARALVRAGVARGDVVGVALPRGPQAVIALLGVLRAAAAYLPLDLDYPADRLRFMLADAGVKRVLLGAELTAQQADALPEPVRRLDVQALLAPVPPDAPDADPVLPGLDGEDLAYVMYTSGSTGQPKGVAICHRSIVRLVKAARYMRLDQTVAMLQAAPLGFDASTLEIWGPLLNGGSCVLHDEAIPTGPGLAASVRELGANTAWLTAALFNAVVDDDPLHLAGLRQLLIGGEALSPGHVRRFLAAAPQTTLINGYGPTECTTFALTHRIEPAEAESGAAIPIGRPVTRTPIYILDAHGEPLPPGLVGELVIGGLGVGRGYLGRPELNAERFVPDRFAAEGGLMYRTGDLVRFRVAAGSALPDAMPAVEFVGRADGQVKIRGFRIETGEIEAVLATHPSVQAAAVVARRDADRGVELVAYVVPASSPAAAVDAVWQPAVLRAHLAARLPEFMVPVQWVRLDALPVTANGKLDRRALPAPARERPAHLVQPYVAPRPGLEQTVADIFAGVLGLDRVGALDNFFDLGGSSLLIMKAHAALRRTGHEALSVAAMFAAPTARGLAQRLEGGARAEGPAVPVHRVRPGEPVAIVGMAGRFPGAADIEAFWRVLDEGRDTIRFFRAEELDASIPAELRADPQYVPARGVLDDVELFDAGFFGIPPNEAELMDPQQRIFLELCWECLERAGQVPQKTAGAIGVYAGMYNASYFLRHVQAHPQKVARVGEFQVMLANETDYIATRTAHRLDLTGPAVSVHTACSTSLVAIAQAFEALQSGQCELALAGGVSVTCPPASGYLYQEGSMLSPDGHTRSFDADAQGTVFSDGAAVVLLKPLSAALADGNTVYAVIRSVAVNNDGAAKASFTAPSVEGQVAVVSRALARAGVQARQVSYVEAHGTATPLGDPVEVAALAEAFRRSGGGAAADGPWCTLGSLKSNTGHMVIAAGAAGVIKTALALHHERLPGTAHFRRPNPQLGLEHSPFVVRAEARAWPRSVQPRLAGVSSLGVGGTNAHVILEEAPLLPRREAPPDAAGMPQLLRLSARTPQALADSCRRLADHLDGRVPSPAGRDTPPSEPASPREDERLQLADIAHTLQVGRADFAERCFVVAEDLAGAAAALRAPDGAAARRRSLPAAEAQVVLVFPGQGAQYAGMGRELHARVPAFRLAWDECSEALDGAIRADVQAACFGDDPAALMRTEITQPATFCLEYALARTWLAAGLQPAGMLGHSVGEFVAAVLAGVMPLADAMRLVARRGALMQALPPGAMLSVRLAAAELEPLLPPTLQLAAENGPTACVVAGPEAAVEAFASDLSARVGREVVSRRLQTSHAFHSAMMDPAVAPFEAEVRRVALAAPRLPVISTVDARLLDAARATDPGYWARHLRQPVRFSPAVQAAGAAWPQAVFLECGPRATLSTLVRQHRQLVAVPSLADTPQRELIALQEAAGQLWTLGVELDWPASPAHGRRRVVLPTYPFERRRYWVDAGTPLPSPPAVAPSPSSSQEPAMSLATPAAEAGRKPALIGRLRVLFEDVSGIELADADPTLAFVELGLDSLTLTQVALQLKKEFKLGVTFRQLMETYRSFDALAAHLDASLPPEAQPAPAAPAVVPPLTAAPGAAAGMVPALAPAAVAPSFAIAPAAPLSAAGLPLLQHVIQQQMQLMAQQLALLQGAGAGAAAAVPAPQPLPVAAASAAAVPSASGDPAAPAAAPRIEAAPAPSAAGRSVATPSDEEAALAHRSYDVKKAFGAIARIHTAGGLELSERQLARLDAFMRRYIERTAKSKAYTVEHRPHLADPRVVNGFRPQIKEIIYQIVVERSKGARMWDLDGNEYVDALNGFGMSLFGWQPDFVLDAVRKQLDSGYDIGPQHPLAGEVARLFCELTGFERAGLCNTGSEAVMGCVRIARTVTGRSKIAMFTGAYHGIFDEVIVRGTKKLKSVPAAPGIMPNTAENVVVLDYGTPETLQWLKDHADELAAVLVEPVQSRRPDFQPREFLRELRELTSRSGTLLIFDEVVTGFRCHPGGIQALWGIRADLGSYGKVVGGGFPIGVIAGKREYMDALDGGHWQYGDDSIPTVGVTYFAGTFVRHPLALVAAQAVLEHLRREGPDLQAALTRRTAAMVDELNAYCREVGAPIVLKSFASVWKLFFEEEHPLQDLLFAMMRNRGVHILDNFPCFMTTAHTAEDIAVIKTAFKEAVAELQESEFLPRRLSAKAVEFNASRPPVPGARLGRDADGKPAWFVANPDAPGKYIKVEAS